MCVMSKTLHVQEITLQHDERPRLLFIILLFLAFGESWESIASAPEQCYRGRGKIDGSIHSGLDGCMHLDI